ncbi:TVP38/TMEM64 family protein [Streptococcus sp. DD13]|uniref:TVP38/TMEM64 family protein n=1 Tax=Streptococcus sp. DD13 TaxID=1777881 RepID=UPI00079BE81F|nr:TVP38/TMEM64 family protein [Streptococcus sp. DD13]KXT78633.1 Immunoreactive protein Se23.5 [Streptococcus sp. DD13]
METSKAYKFFQKLIQILSVIVVIASVVFVIWLLQIGILNDQNQLKTFIEQQGVWGILTFTALQAFQVVFPIIPGGITTIVGFLVFDPITAFFVNYIGINLGSIILFYLARKYGKAFCLLFMKPETYQKYIGKIDDKKGYELFFIYCMLSPISPADVVVMITGLTSMSYKRFFIIIMLCRPISIVGYSLLWIFGGRWIRNFL